MRFIPAIFEHDRVEVPKIEMNQSTEVVVVFPNQTWLFALFQNGIVLFHETIPIEGPISVNVIFPDSDLSVRAAIASGALILPYKGG